MKREANIVPNAVSSEAMKQKYTQPGHSNYETLLVTTQDCITTITMNRPEKKNAMSPQMCLELSAALEDAANDDSVFTVITGAGDYFSSGSDLTSALKSKEQLDAPPVNSENPYRHIVKKIIDFQKPLIAVVNGPAVGIGVTVLALFDTVYATERATFNTPFSKLALHPEACSSYTFPRIMGPSKAIEILMFNRKFTAREACDVGLVAEVFPDSSFHREVRTKLKEYAKLPKNCLTASKQLIRDMEKEKLHEVCDKEFELIQKRANSKESLEAIKNFFRKKANLTELIVAHLKYQLPERMEKTLGFCNHKYYCAFYAFISLLKSFP
ncbi:enoyl-CoA delta isomerase 3, peroxisomal-like [Pelobates fuscus]|uniref:enoyl-CoA delta isomerase 3, peroxisomal-like n=1 Tax=Pelobates fuscus TaxID=191477 RepID=UPI002FE49320